jgi:nitrate reductase gamma subunit
MVRRHDTTALILLGVVIGVGNNLTYTSAQHALEAYDDDHDEDGAFVALREIVLNSGYAVVPILLGMIYAQGGFVASLELVAVSM